MTFEDNPVPIAPEASIAHQDVPLADRPSVVDVWPELERPVTQEAIVEKFIAGHLRSLPSAAKRLDDLRRNRVGVGHYAKNGPATERRADGHVTGHQRSHDCVADRAALKINVPNSLTTTRAFPAHSTIPVPPQIYMIRTDSTANW